MKKKNLREILDTEYVQQWLKYLENKRGPFNLPILPRPV